MVHMEEVNEIGKEKNCWTSRIAMKWWWVTRKTGGEIIKHKSGEISSIFDCSTPSAVYYVVLVKCVKVIPGEECFSEHGLIPVHIDLK